MDPQAEEGTVGPREQSRPEMQAEREAPGKMRQYAAALLFCAVRCLAPAEARQNSGIK